jgi:cytoskeletal protein CcmA (bactofilin family)
MSIWKDTASQLTATPAPDAKKPVRYEPLSTPEPTPAPVVAPLRSDAVVSGKESVIAADITIEGKIEGGGSVRIAGKFKGDVNVQGDLTVEVGAKLTGAVRAHTVTIAGELEGNVEQATRVDLLQTGVVIGDVKAGALAVAPGARMRGHAEFGWEDDKSTKAGKYSNGRGAESGTVS